MKKITALILAVACRSVAVAWRSVAVPVCCYFIATSLSSCSDQPAPSVTVGTVTVALTGLDDDLAGLDVQLRNISTGSTFVEQTDHQGTATFSVVPGLYEASTSQTRTTEGNEYYSYNGASGQITVQGNQLTQVAMAMKRAVISRLVIKELYCGGCMADDGVTSFQYDKCVILYNNSAEPASYDNLCFGMGAPANAQATNNNYTDDGHLTYEGEGFTPVWNGIWYFPATLTIAPYSQVVVTVFMVLSGCNFSLLLLSLSWRSFAILKNQEFRTFLLYTLFLGIGIGLVLLFARHLSFGSAFRQSFFSVISAFTTTGFFVSDYTQWPTFLSIILFLLMFIGASSGSTSGGIKIFRHLIFLKNSFLELKRIIHPNAVLPVKVNGKSISTSGVYKNITFIVIYFLVFVVGAIILLATGIDFNTAIGASVATLSNVGTGIGSVGPGGSYVLFPLGTKWVLMLLMLLGRVELFSLITLLSRSFWRN